MALELKLNQKLSQTLVMTPQLQQAIKLLQLGRMEYLEVIEKELLENPVLEEIPESDRNTEGENHSQESNQNFEAEQSAETPAENVEMFAVEGENSALELNARNATEQGSESVASELMFENGDFFGETISSSSTVRKNYSEGERPSIEQTVSSPEGLTSHILWQLRTTDLPKEDEEIAIQIVGNLDRNGYLCCTLEELVELCQRDRADVERVLSLVQTLDPIGIGARDLRECLLIQLDQIGLQDSVSWRIVDLHLGDLEVRRYDVIAKAIEVEVEEVYEAIKSIMRLEPRPGRPFVEEAPIYITPDVYVRKVSDDYVITLNESGIPKLRLNPQYQELLNNGAGKDEQEKEYLQDRLRSASWLIKSIQQRQQTIYRVTESIMRFQRDFLEKGVSELKPLVLRDVAQDVGMHESTVSRVTTNKYVHTPQGVFELKFFFSSGLKSGAGEVSSESVKEKIRELIANENPKKPLSDQAIVNSLQADGIDIARRTVAKYREMMNILSSSRRKKVF